MGCRLSCLCSNVGDALGEGGAAQVTPVDPSCVPVDEEPPSFILNLRAGDEETVVYPSVCSK